MSTTVDFCHFRKMTYAEVAKNEWLDFRKIPLHIQDLVLEKMTFQSYTTFIETSSTAHYLDARNPRLQYPIPIKRFMLTNDKVTFIAHGHLVTVSTSTCRKMKFASVSVAVGDLSFKEETCDFLLNLNIDYMQCSILLRDDSHTTEFFKKARIDKLNLMAQFLPFGVERFPFDTSNIHKVSIDNCRSLLFDPFSTIKARNHVELTDVPLTGGQILEYIKSLRMGFLKVVDVTISNFTMTDHREIDEYLYTQCSQVFATPCNQKWEITRKDESKPFMTFEVLHNTIYIRGC